MGEICLRTFIKLFACINFCLFFQLSCTTSHPSEGEENHLSDAEENHSGQKRGHSDLDSDNESISPEELQEFTDKLRPYFSEAELLERSPYDKQALCSQLSNYERACSAGNLFSLGLVVPPLVILLIFYKKGLFVVTLQDSSQQTGQHLWYGLRNRQKHQNNEFLLMMKTLLL